MGLGRCKRNVEGPGLGQRRHFGHGRRFRAGPGRQARRIAGLQRCEQPADQLVGLGTAERSDDAHARAAGVDQALVKVLHGTHIDARQRGLGGLLAVRVAAIDGLGKSLGGHGSCGQLGSAIWRAARRVALSSSAGSVSERSA
ncbi:hypothetical protein D3C78_1123480 [compost metagenome]